ncbi:MAG: ABC transporter substrate-binding protein [Betaproteobacteria bacterium]|nr:ABC transporter substrate-binding protein [Betaproteobacteria bacterium]
MSVGQRRRILLAGGAVLTVPLFVLAQTDQRSARVAYLLQGDLAAAKHLVGAFKDEMTKRGWREGANVEYALREGLNDFGRLDALAAEVVAQRPDVIVVSTATVAQAARKHTSSIPIVFWVVPDPIAAGLVASLAKPGGNATGTTSRFEGIWGKRLQLMHQIIPSLRRVAFLYDPRDSQDTRSVQQVQLAGKELAIEVELFEVSRPEDFKASFSAIKNAKIGAVILGSPNMFFVHRKLLADLALEHGMPISHAVSEGAEAGALFSYSIILALLNRHAARYADRILKGAKPADLPVEQPSVIELVVNLKTAKALGLTIPGSILLRADRVIE